MTATNPSCLEPNEKFYQARGILSQLLQSPEILKEFEGEEPSNSRMVYTQGPTLWLLVLQRAGGGLTLEQAVKELALHHSDLLPENRRVSEGRLSGNNSAYSRARKRVPLSVVENFSRRICDHLAQRTKPAFLDRRVFILDGTTMTLPPTPELKKAFPPASNQFGESVWPVAMLLVAHEMQTGCALVPQINAMYGPDNSHETQQALKAIEQLPQDSIVMADSGFGIFSVAWGCQTSAKQFVLRLTKQRYKKHLKNARLVEEIPGCRTHSFTWKPSAKERRNNPHLTKEASIEIFIHQIDLDNGQTLELITDIQVDGHSLGALYQHRYDVEFDIRDIKVTMDTENIRAQSVDTVMKELHGSLIAYNLVMQLRRQAAELINIAPRRLSFSGVWTTFRYHLLYANIETLEEGQLAYQLALISASQRVLPNRKERRQYPRVAHTRRQKSTSFQRKLATQNSKQLKPACAEHPPD